MEQEHLKPVEITNEEKKNDIPVLSHDAFFKASLSDPEVAKDFVRAHLPPKLLAKMELATLKLSPSSFVKPTLRQCHTDLLFNVKIAAKDSYFYTLVEHQSQHDKRILMRLMQYNMAIADRHMDTYGVDKMPTIFNIVLSNSKHPYKGPLTLYELSEDPRLARQTLGRCSYVDLITQSDETLAGHGRVGFAELLLKHAHVRDFYNFLLGCIDKLYIRLSFEKFNHVVQSLVYMLAHDQKNPPSVLVELLLHLSPNRKEEVMNALDKLQQEGREEGREEGMQKGRAEGMQKGRAEGRAQVVEALLGKGFSQAKLNELLPSEFL